MEIRFLNKNNISKEIWNQGIKNPTQLYEYSNTKGKYSEPIFIIIIDDKNNVFKWQLFITGISFLKYVEIVSEPNILDSNLVKIAITEIEKRFKPFKIVFYSITLSRFQDRSFFMKNHFNSIYEYGSNIINLTLSKEELFQNIHSKHRNVIRKAEKNGVVIYEDTSENGIVLFQKISVETYARSNKDGLSLDYLKRHFHALKDSGNIRLFFAKKDDVIQAAAVFLVSKTVAIYWHGASIDNIYPGSANLLHWFAIQTFKSEQKLYYDFGGFSFSEDEKASSINRFKSRFGGELIRFYGGEKIINKFFNFIYNIYKGLKK